MSQSIVNLPGPLPAEVAVLGTPDQVFVPGTGQRPPLVYLLTTVFGVVAGIICWVSAAIAMGLFPLPGQAAWPMEAALGLGIPSMIVGTLFLIWAAWLASGGGIKTQAYLLFADVLVELHPNRHRLIPWEKIGTPKVFDAMHKEFWFPVQDGKPVHFDYTMPDHDRLLQALSRRHLLVTLGGETVRAALAAGTPAPHFLACGNWLTASAIYRISVIGDSIIGLRVGEGSTEDPTNDPRHNTAAGGLGGAAAAWGNLVRIEKYRKFRAAMNRVEGSDEQELFEFASEFHGSFLIPAADLVELRLDPASFWSHLGLSLDVSRLHLVQAKEDKRTLDIPSHGDLMTARKVLAKIRP